MKNVVPWLIRIGLFVIYYVVVYNLTLPNFWLSAVIALLLVYAFSNANRIGAIEQLFKGGLVQAFQQNDELHDKHQRAVDELQERVSELEVQIQALQSTVSGLEDADSVRQLKQRQHTPEH
ncbi:hypothetical protein [Aquabacterium sp.]|uniref:hypothetical protein n=1 Tax=Aquabacterium sp. TaxID=1872578 RepID=UPI003BB049B2